MKCLKCNRRVVDTFESKFRHVVKYHPHCVAEALTRFLVSPQTGFRVGELFGEYVKQRIKNAIKRGIPA